MADDQTRSAQSEQIPKESEARTHAVDAAVDAILTAGGEARTQAILETAVDALIPIPEYGSVERRDHRSICLSPQLDRFAKSGLWPDAILSNRS
jgi:hypothetical protein